MHYLMDSLPLACVGYVLATQKNHKNRERAFFEASADELRPYLEYVPPRVPKRIVPDSVTATREAYKRTDNGTADHSKLPRIWAFDSGPYPDRVGLGAARVREMNLAAHVAFESISWGSLLDPKRLASEIRVTSNGKTFVLPLNDKFIYCQWWVRKPVALPSSSGFDLIPAIQSAERGPREVLRLPSHEQRRRHLSR